MRLAEEAGSSYRDVDAELWEVLDICEDHELEEIHTILFGTPAPVAPAYVSSISSMELGLSAKCWNPAMRLSIH
jgi:hypothetical protein